MVHLKKGALAVAAALLLTTSAFAQQRVVTCDADDDPIPLAAMEALIADIEAANPDIDLQPTLVNDIPPQLIALTRTSMNVQELAAQALLTRNREHTYPASMPDPPAVAEPDLRQIRAMVDDLIAAHGASLPGWISGKKAT